MDLYLFGPSIKALCEAPRGFARLLGTLQIPSVLGKVIGALQSSSVWLLHESLLYGGFGVPPRVLQSSSV